MRASSARHLRSTLSSRATWAADGSDAIGSRAAYNGFGRRREPAFTTRAWPADAMAHVDFAASSSASKLISSEYANAVFSPDTARTPTPCSMLKLADLTMPSSRLQPSEREYWK